MGKHEAKKSGDKLTHTERVLLITAILELVNALLSLAEWLAD